MTGPLSPLPPEKAQESTQRAREALGARGGVRKAGATCARCGVRQAARTCRIAAVPVCGPCEDGIHAQVRDLLRFEAPAPS